MIRRTLLLVSCAAIAGSLSLGCGEDSKEEIPRNVEEARVTSPSRMLDAVLIREDGGGAIGGWEWYVYIVAQGSPVERKSREIFHAGTLTGEKLVWIQPHLLEIRYDIADVEEFRNLWGLHEIRDAGSAGEHDYLVEIRLVPSSQDFSLLCPDGGFKSKEEKKCDCP